MSNKRSPAPERIADDEPNASNAKRHKGEVNDSKEVPPVPASVHDEKQETILFRTLWDGKWGGAYNTGFAYPVVVLNSEYEKSQASPDGSVPCWYYVGERYKRGRIIALHELNPDHCETGQDRYFTQLQPSHSSVKSIWSHECKVPASIVHALRTGTPPAPKTKRPLEPLNQCLEAALRICSGMDADSKVYDLTECLDPKTGMMTEACAKLPRRL